MEANAPRNGVVHPNGRWERRTIPYQQAILLESPDYTTDPAAALLLVEHMRKAGRNLLLWPHEDGWSCTVDTWTSGAIVAVTFPLAICKAFCLANNINIDPKE